MKRKTTSNPYRVVLFDYERVTLAGIAGRAGRLSRTSLSLLPLLDRTCDESIFVVVASNDALQPTFKLVEEWGITLVQLIPVLRYIPGEKSVYILSHLAVARRGRGYFPPFTGPLSVQNEEELPDQVRKFCERFPGPYLEVGPDAAAPGWAVYVHDIDDELSIPETLDERIVERAMKRIRDSWRASDRARWEIGDTLIDLVRQGMAHRTAYRLALRQIRGSGRVNSESTLKMYYQVALTFQRSERDPHRTWNEYWEEHRRINKTLARRQAEVRRRMHDELDKLSRVRLAHKTAQKDGEGS